MESLESLVREGVKSIEKVLGIWGLKGMIDGLLMPVSFGMLGPQAPERMSVRWLGGRDDRMEDMVVRR